MERLGGGHRPALAAGARGSWGRRAGAVGLWDLGARPFVSDTDTAAPLFRLYVAIDRILHTLSGGDMPMPKGIIMEAAEAAMEEEAADPADDDDDDEHMTAADGEHMEAADEVIACHRLHAC